MTLTPARAHYIEQSVIHSFATQSLRTIGLAYRDFGSRDELPASWNTSPDEWTPTTPTIEEVCVNAPQLFFSCSCVPSVGLLHVFDGREFRHCRRVLAGSISVMRCSLARILPRPQLVGCTTGLFEG